MGVRRFMREVVTQWRSLSMEVRSVRSMLEEVLSNWERYTSTVASLQAWLEDAEEALSQPENVKQEFFRNLSHWMDLHTAMNDAGNFLIETCDETVSLDLKQQLLLLNGRWRDLFLKVKQHAHSDELEKWRKDHLKALWTLKELLETAEAKLNAPVQVSFLSVRAFLQDVESTKQKVVSMETQYKLAACSAQLLVKDAPQDEAARVMATMAKAKTQLSKVRERCPSLVRECHILLPLLEEMEKHISGFYQAVERATTDNQLTKIKKYVMIMIERNHQTLQKSLGNSKVLRNFDMSLLQKRLSEIQGSSQDFFGQLDQRVLSVFLKACDELTDILPQEEQQSLQETVRPPDRGSLSPASTESGCGEKSRGFDSSRLQSRAGKRDTGPVRHLHQRASDQRAQGKSWILWKLRAQINRTGRAPKSPIMFLHFLLLLLQTFFRERKPLTLCERRIRNMEDLCHKLPDNDPIYRMLDSTKKAVEEVTEQITITHLKLEQHPDKWKEWNDRKEAEQLVTHCRQLQTGEVLSQPLHELEGAFSKVDHKSGTAEHNLQELFIDFEEYSVRADILLEKAEDIQLGPKNQGLLLQQAQSSREMVTQLQKHLKERYEHEAELQKNASLTETLIQKESSLLHRSTPEAEQQLQAWTEDCLQLFNESQRLLLVSKECLTKLKTFLVKREAASKALRHLNEAVEGRGSWDHSKAEALHRGIVDVAKDIARLEAEAVGLDGLLSKAHLHLCVSESTRSKNISDPQGRTSCRGLAVDLMMALEEVQRAVGWRQSEADALGALWCSFRERKEEVMMNLNKIEDDARREEAKECSVQAFQNRQEQSGVVVDLLRLFLHLKTNINTVVESAQAVANNLPDHNHNAQDARSIFTQ
ncbi:hypothetical protein GOODEAATRI_002167, partial [Goodea atripinnis]